MKLKIQFYDQDMTPDVDDPIIWEVDTADIVGMNGRRLAAGVPMVEVFGYEPESNVVISESIYFRRFEWDSMDDDETPAAYFSRIGKEIESDGKHIYHAWLENQWMTIPEVRRWAARMGVSIAQSSIAYNVANGKLFMDDKRRIALDDAYRFICNWYENPPKSGCKPSGKAVRNG